MAREQAWLNSSRDELDPFARRTEHLEPNVGAVVMFQGRLPDFMKGAEGQRWYLLEKYPHPDGRMFYYFHSADHYYSCTVDQEIMDRCGRLLVGREEQEE